MDVPVQSAHSFVVEIGGTRMAAFTECTLPNLEIEVEEVKEGGRNEYVHVLPGQRKSGRIILKRGLTTSLDLFNWYKQMLSGGVAPATKTVSIILFDSLGNPLARWDFNNAFPVKWTGPTLKSDQSAIAIEQLEIVVHALA
jgi:phage tail-like protein